MAGALVLQEMRYIIFFTFLFCCLITNAMEQIASSEVNSSFASQEMFHTL
jgi:hypothetical protein